MKDLLNSSNFRRMVFFIMVGILVIGMISAISRMGNETLTDYAEKNPEIAYGETDTSWRDAYHFSDNASGAGTVSGNQ